MRVGQRPVLRVRRRRSDARGAGRRLAGLGLGPERRAVRRSGPPRPSSRRSRARGWPTCSACPPQVSVGFVTGAQMANFTGLAAALHAVLRPGRLGRGARRGCGGLRGSGCWPASSGTARSTGRCASSASARRRSCRWPPTTRGGCGSTRSPRRSTAGRPGDRVRAGRQRQHRRGRPGRRDQRHRPPARRVGARRRRVRAVGGGEPAAAAAGGRRRSGPTRGRPTRTSGSTCPTTAAWSSAPTRRRTGPRWAPGRATSCTAAAGERDALDHNPEHSRRARGFAVYAALRALGRSGVAELVERSCALARRFAEQLGAAPGVEVLNDVVLNQVLVRFGGLGRATTRRAWSTRVQRDGTCWMSGTDVAGPGGDADLGVELVDRRGGRRPVGRGDPAVHAGGGLIDRLRPRSEARRAPRPDGTLRGGDHRPPPVVRRRRGAGAGGLVAGVGDRGQHVAQRARRQRGDARPEPVALVE